MLDEYDTFRKSVERPTEDREVTNVMIRPAMGEFYATLCFDDNSFTEHRKPTKQAAVDFALQFVTMEDIIF